MDKIKQIIQKKKNSEITEPNNEILIKRENNNDINTLVIKPVEITKHSILSTTINNKNDNIFKIKVNDSISNEELNIFTTNNNKFKDKYLALKEYKRRKHDLSDNITSDEINNDIIIYIKLIYKEFINKINKDNIMVLSKDIKNSDFIITQTEKYLNYLINLLNDNEIDNAITKNFYHCVHFSYINEHNFALENYLDISVGKNAWPIGIAKSILSDKPINPKIYIPKSKNYLKNEFTKMYMTCFKRLLSFKSENKI